MVNQNSLKFDLFLPFPQLLFMMNTLLLEIINVENKLSIIEQDIEYLARCYINEETNFELPMNDGEAIVDMSYDDLKNKVSHKIQLLSPNTYIDESNLMSYIDYYYQFVS
uniref:Uncharacterized protein n=1 Tax=Pyramimonas orientalis virus TaxID=455367 RepID=A0A7M3UP50_POV01|nr:hypothetical protein HWQ62_00378 [Pyramimonas orientalis virus]